MPHLLHHFSPYKPPIARFQKEPFVERSLKAAICAAAANAHFVRTADLHARCSEGPQSALNIAMCMAQHLSQ
jgi:hypothetical protein